MSRVMLMDECPSISETTLTFTSRPSSSVLAATAFLAGLAPFAVLVWLRVSRHSGAPRSALSGCWQGGLLLALAVAGVGELSSYAVRASGDP
jgi:hypothetical protein